MSTATTTTHRLVRRTDDRMIAGVCSGVADYLGVDVTVVRLIAVVGGDSPEQAAEQAQTIIDEQLGA